MNLLVVFIIMANILPTIKGFKNQIFFNKYKFSVSAVQKGDKYRMFTSGFLHVDYMHLGFNMYALYLFSGTILHYFSGFEYLLIYICSLLAGNFLALYINKNNTFYSAVGASGAVTGIIYASIVLFPDMEMYLILIPIPLKAYVFGIGYLLFSIYGMKNQVGNVGHSAHIGGAIAGYILTLILKPDVFALHPVKIALLAVPIFILFVLQNKKVL